MGGGCDCASILLTPRLFRVKKHNLGRTGELDFLHLVDRIVQGRSMYSNKDDKRI